jgi:hypothetical protein
MPSTESHSARVQYLLLALTCVAVTAMAVERGKNPIGGGSCNCGDGVNGCDAGVRASGGGQPCLVRHRPRPLMILAQPPGPIATNCCYTD